MRSVVVDSGFKPVRGLSIRGSTATPKKLYSLRTALMGVLAGVSIISGALAITGLSPQIAMAREKEDGAIALSGEQYGVVRRAELPPEALRTERLILSGGPFPYDKDGSVFGNRERQLPKRKRGHYREYTVPTPGAANRGAKRIVCGGPKPREPEVCYYTQDHYSSFRRIAP